MLLLGPHPMFDPALRLLSITEVAEILGISKAGVRRLIERGELRAKKLGRRVLIHPESLASLLRDE